MVKWVNSADSNWRPWSVMMVVGIPYLENHVETRLEATISAEISVIGISSNHRVFLSIMVKMWEKPRSGGSGPTIST